jgi:hypothetical protein
VETVAVETVAVETAAVETAAVETAAVETAPAEETDFASAGGWTNRDEPTGVTGNSRIVVRIC